MISAIFLAIEKEQAQQWIKKHDKNASENIYIFDDDGESVIIHAEGIVDISNHKFEKIPYIFGSIKGSFIANNCGLATLVNSPFEVSEDYVIQNNQISNLAGCPEYVGRNFDISNNIKLNNFASGPQTVIANYIVSGAPKLKSISALNTHFGRFSHIVEDKKNMLTGLENKYNRFNSNCFIFQSTYDNFLETKKQIKTTR